MENTDDLVWIRLSCVSTISINESKPWIKSDRTRKNALRGLLSAFHIYLDLFCRFEHYKNLFLHKLLHLFRGCDTI